MFAAVPVAVLAWSLMLILILRARAPTCVFVAAVLLEVASASSAASAAASAAAVAAMVVADLAAAAAAVAVVAAVPAAAVLRAPRLAGPRFAPPREPKSWPRDKSLGRALRLRPRPSLRFRLRIPEPIYPQPDSFLVDSEPEYRRAEEVSEWEP